MVLASTCIQQCPASRFTAPTRASSTTAFDTMKRPGSIHRVGTGCPDRPVRSARHVACATCSIAGLVAPGRRKDGSRSGAQPPPRSSTAV